jgi:hypothetical protein
MPRGAHMGRKGARTAVVYCACAPLGAETSRGAMFSSLMKRTTLVYPGTLSTMYVWHEVHSIGVDFPHTFY